MIKTRIMNQRLSSPVSSPSPSNNHNGLLYKGVIDCFCKVVKNEGFLALYKGFFLIWARMVR
ncbi:unnamed protein product [Trichobilharzia regenti]|nr:unnamed protein product [Trichobilharzia regenti]